jgi:adenine-specific DNA-methyltransferase
MCSAFCGGKPDRYPTLTIKKIPKAVLSRCEWGKHGYSLQVENLPKAPPPKGQMELIPTDGNGRALEMKEKHSSGTT